eukprot:gene14297-20275_t
MGLAVAGRWVESSAGWVGRGRRRAGRSGYGRRVGRRSPTAGSVAGTAVSVLRPVVGRRPGTLHSVPPCLIIAKLSTDAGPGQARPPLRCSNPATLHPPASPAITDARRPC